MCQERDQPIIPCKEENITRANAILDHDSGQIMNIESFWTGGQSSHKYNPLQFPNRKACRAGFRTAQVGISSFATPRKGSNERTISARNYVEHNALNRLNSGTEGIQIRDNIEQRYRRDWATSAICDSSLPEIHLSVCKTLSCSMQESLISILLRRIQARKQSSKQY